MKKSKSILVIMSTALLVLGVVVSSFLADEYSSLIATVTTTVTAIIGAVALYIQFKKDKEVNQASFILEFYKSFYENEDNVKVINVLDKIVNGEKTDWLLKKENYSAILNYLSWIRTLCSLIDRNVISFDAIDETFSYKFFAILNNKDVQKVELVPYADLYTIMYRTHRRWVAYREKHGKNELQAASSLSKVSNYEELSK